ANPRRICPALFEHTDAQFLGEIRCDRKFTANAAMQFWVSVAECSGFYVVALHLSTQFTNQTVHMLLFIGRWVFGRKLQLRPSTEEAHISVFLSRIDDTERDHAKAGHAREEEIVAAARLHQRRYAATEIGRF